MGLIVVSNRQITEITVDSHRRRAFYPGSVAGDAKAQPGSCESEGANGDAWLGNSLLSMLGQWYA